MIAPFQAPFALILRYFSQWFGNYGLALIMLGIVITLIRIPFDIKTKRSTMKQTLLGPKLREIQEKHKNNQQRLMVETQKLWKEEGVKPMGGCIWMILPMLIIIMLFGIIREPLTHLMGLSEYQIEALRYYVVYTLELPVNEGIHMQTSIAGYIQGRYADMLAVVQGAYPYVATNFYEINMNFVGLPIGETPQWNFFLQDETRNLQNFALFMLPILSVVAIYLQQKVMMATNVMMQSQMQQPQMMKTMFLMMPLMSLWIGFTFPAAMSIYWTTTGILFTIVSIFINRHFKGIYAAMQAEMDAKDKERQAVIEAKRAATERKRQEGKTEENKGTSKKKKQMAEREKERQRLASQKADERADEDDQNPSRVGHRKYARGRAYDPNRFEHGAVEQDTDLDHEDYDELEDNFTEDMAISPTLLPAIEVDTEDGLEDETDLDDDYDYDEAYEDEYDEE